MSFKSWLKYLQQNSASTTMPGYWFSMGASLPGASPTHPVRAIFYKHWQGKTLLSLWEIMRSQFEKLHFSDQWGFSPYLAGEVSEDSSSYLSLPRRICLFWWSHIPATSAYHHDLTHSSHQGRRYHHKERLQWHFCHFHKLRIWPLVLNL